MKKLRLLLLKGSYEHDKAPADPYSDYSRQSCKSCKINSRIP
ncbi:hypothetical protein [Campylobacter sp.]|nr:hypothetical protein [Campylobacter sp.]